MFKTAFLSASLAVAGYACSAWLTHDFQVWTAEGARRLEVALQPITVPSVQVEGSGLAPQGLSHLLSDGQAVTLVDFIYTRCQTVCLSMGSVYQQMQATLQAAGQTDASARRVKLLSISFDGENDKPPILQAYATRLNADPLIWRFVSLPDPKETQRLLADFQVIVVPDGRGDFEHNAALLVVNQRGQLVRIFDYAEQQLALNYARDLLNTLSPR